jgi:ankyrin repeat protein
LGIVNLLAEIRPGDNVKNKTTFHYSKNTTVAKLRAFLSKGGSLDALTPHGETLLMEACRFRHVRGIKFIISKGAEINAQDKHGDTALFYLLYTRKNHSRIIAFLLKNGADVNHKNMLGVTPLIEAASHNNHQAAVEILKFNPDLNATTRNDETALTHAIAWGYTKMAQRLIDAGANVKWKNKWGTTILEMAACAENLPIVDLLLKKGCNPDTLKTPYPVKNTSLLLFLLIGRFREKIFKRLLKSVRLINRRNADGYTALRYAKENFMVRAVKLLEAKNGM